MSASLFFVKEHVIDGAHVREYARATSISQDAVVKIHVKEYVPKSNPSPRKGDVTIIGAHANGFPKVAKLKTPQPRLCILSADATFQELYEPFWDDLYRDCQKKGVRIRAIWIADCAWQGQSGRLNLQAGTLGNDRKLAC